jgi:hypothetical protein
VGWGRESAGHAGHAVPLRERDMKFLKIFMNFLEMMVFIALLFGYAVLHTMNECAEGRIGECRDAVRR